MMNLKNNWLLLNLIILVGIFGHSIYRDIQIEKQYPGDLRNRLVGARLQKDGKLPYFFHWTQADYPRYADPFSSQDSTVPASTITASPFFHELLIPVCEIPQRTFSRLWLGMEYIMLIVMVWMICSFNTSRIQKLVTLNVGVLFTLTQAWISLIFEGQLYFFTAFLICCIMCALLSNKKSAWVLGGICAAMLVLTRPIALVIFVPFIFQFRRYPIFLISSIAALGFYGLFVLTNHSEKLLWENYRLALQKHTELHQYGDHNIIFNLEGADIPNLEGFDFKEVKENVKNYPVTEATESGSVYVIYKNITHHKMPLRVLIALSLISLFLLLAVFFYFNRKKPFQVFQVLTFSFLLYILLEFFSPVERHLYNVVQWFPIILFAFLFLPLQNWKSPVFMLLVLGLLLSCLTVSWIPDRNTLGEIAWFFACLIIIFSPKYFNSIQWR